MRIMAMVFLLAAMPVCADDAHQAKMGALRGARLDNAYSELRLALCRADPTKCSTYDKAEIAKMEASLAEMGIVTSGAPATKEELNKILQDAMK
jgi:hypothetical protein